MQVARSIIDRGQLILSSCLFRVYSLESFLGVPLQDTVQDGGRNLNIMFSMKSCRFRKLASIYNAVQSDLCAFRKVNKQVHRLALWPSFHLVMVATSGFVIQLGDTYKRLISARPKPRMQELGRLRSGNLSQTGIAQWQSPLLAIPRGRTSVLAGGHRFARICKHPVCGVQKEFGCTNSKKETRKYESGHYEMV